MPFFSLSGRSLSIGMDISCIFPECPTAWYLVPARSEERIRAMQVQQGWRYVRAAPTSFGLAWGWACPDPTRHFIDGNPQVLYRHDEEMSHG